MKRCILCFIIALLVPLNLGGSVLGLSGNLVFYRTITNDGITLQIKGDGYYADYQLFPPKAETGINSGSELSISYTWNNRTVSVCHLKDEEGIVINVSDGLYSNPYPISHNFLKRLTVSKVPVRFDDCTESIIPIGINDQTVILLYSLIFDDQDCGYEYLIIIEKGKFTIFDFYTLLDGNDEEYVNETIKDYKRFHQLP